MEKNTAFELYKLFRSEYYESYTLHRQTIQQYLTFVVAVLGATIAGMLKIEDLGWIGLSVLVGPVLNLFLCKLAIKMCDRFYVGVLERIAVISKLEAIIGLHDPLNENRKDTASFPGDKYLLPERWIKNFQHSTTEEFTKTQLNEGVNRVAKQTFNLLIIINIIIIFTAIATALITKVNP